MAPPGKHVGIETDQVGIEPAGNILEPVEEGWRVIYPADRRPDLTKGSLPVHILTRTLRVLTVLPYYPHQRACPGSARPAPAG